MNLTIDLQEGFGGEAVVVRVDGAEVSRGEVATRRQIGLARSIQVPVTPGQHEVEVEIPKRRLRARRVVDCHAPVWVGVTLSLAGALTLEVSAGPFWYA